MKFIKIFAGIGFGIALLLVIVIVIKQMRDVATDSGDATLASKVHEQLATCFEDKKAYPASLDTIWNQKGMLEYFKKYDVPEKRRAIFQYVGHGNWYELTFTNFGNYHREIATNGLVIH